MRPNRVFFPQALLDAWIADDRVDLAGNDLLLREEGRRYTLAEAFHVVRDAAGAGDRARLVGKVKSKDQLSDLGAEVFENSMILGDDAYDVIPGFVGEPNGVAEPVTRAAQATANEPEEDLLAQFLLKSL